METRANYIAVGFFTLLALLTAFVLIFWFGRYGTDENLVPVDVRVQGSVSGLGVGSVVQFNGINVGRVKGLSLDNDDPRFVIVHTEINNATPLRADTRATIGVRGLSGGAFIQLEGGSPDAVSLLRSADTTGPAPQIAGDPAAIADLLVRINGIAVRTERMMGTLEKFITTNSDTVSRTLHNAETFSVALADNSDGVARFMSSAGDVAKSLEQLSAKLDGSISRAEEILAAVDPKSVSNTLNNIEQFSKTLVEQREQIATLVATVNKGAQELSGFSKNLNSTLAKVDGVVSAVDPKTVASALQNVDKSAQRASELLASVDAASLKKSVDDAAATISHARSLVESVEPDTVRQLIGDLGAASKDISKLLVAIDSSKINSAVDNFSTAAAGAQTIVADVAKVTGPFGNRSNDIDRIITDTSELAARLNASSKKIDDLFSGFENMFGAGEGEGLMADARRTMSEFRRVSRSLDTQISSVARNINAFTRRGLGDTQGLIRDARQSLNRIDRVIRNLQNNPSSLITGSGGNRVRESTGQRPRR